MGLQCRDPGLLLDALELCEVAGAAAHVHGDPNLKRLWESLDAAFKERHVGESGGLDAARRNLQVPGIGHTRGGVAQAWRL